MPIKLTIEEIEAARSEKGGFTRKTLAQWGVMWPPPKGWMECLLAGEEIIDPRKSVKPEQVIQDLAIAIVENGYGHILSQVKSYGVYRGGNPMPTIDQVMKAEGLPDYTIEGEAKAGDVVYRFTCVRPTKSAA